MNQWPDQKRGAEHPRALFTPEQAENLRDRYELGGCTIRQLAEETGASRRTIGRIVTGERYSENG